MKSIKFRCWDKEGKKWLHEVDVYKQLDNQARHNPEVGEYFPLMQFTGLLDKNKNEIYEGDIVESIPLMDKDSRVKGQVIWSEERAMWLVQEIHPKYAETEYLHQIVKEPYQTEIIGNIYQHPELLK